MALAEPVSTEAIVVPPAEDGPLQYLRVGIVGGFTVDMDVDSYEGVNRFGVAFRVQDAANYLLFTIEPETGDWAFSDVVDGSATVQKNGTLESIPDALTISGNEDFFLVDTRSETLTFTSELYPMGSLALYVEGENAVFTLTDLSVGLVGDEAVAAVAMTPTPAPGIADPRRFLHADVVGMLATNDVANSAINCLDYIEIYESLERHLESQSQIVRVIAQDTIEAGEVVYARCRSESPDEPLQFVTAIQDYLEWEGSLRAIRQELEG
jgi:hypothetical protein